MNQTASAACQWHSDSHVLTLTLNERFDYASVHSFSRLLSRADPSDRIVVDMASTRYIDSCGLGLLCALQRGPGGRRDIALVNCCPNIRRILQNCRLERRFQIS